MTRATVYLDEDVHPFIAKALRRRGFRAFTVADTETYGKDDLSQLRLAAQSGHVILTYNVRDFARLHYELLEKGEHHAGVVVATQQEPKRNLRALLHLLSTVSAVDLRDQLVYLNNWA